VVEVAKELEPIVQIALAANPQASTLYELAMALWEAGQSQDSNVVLLHLVKQFPQAPIAIEARIRLARSASDSKDWNTAIAYCTESLEAGCPTEISQHARLIRGQAYFELGSLEQAKGDLELALENELADVELQVSIRFYLAESLYRLEDWAEADRHWLWLLEKAAASKSDAVAESAGWVPIVLLRKAELLAQRKEWEEAKKIVLRIRNDFPKCKHRAEVDYLLARCLISNAEFDAARQALQGLSEEQVFVPTELRARALWMTGETYLMQRQFAQARAAYEAVLLVPDQNYWHSASLLQIGLCCESLLDSQAARVAYERLESQYGDSPFAASARERKNLLPTPSIATQSEQNPLGTKR
jgi:TolA-binding protein